MLNSTPPEILPESKWDPTRPPLLTPDLPGIGGRLKEQLTDFDVTEISTYELSGTGEHLYLWIEKTDMSADYFVRQIGKRLGIPAAEVGTAGMKDRRAVTRQWVSVPASAEPRIGQIDGENMRVLNTNRHNNKLKPGHLRGNAFNVLIRGASDVSIDPIVERIRRDGLPNYYGPQRFGRDNETSKLGLSMLKGEPSRIRQGFLRKMALSAAQSWLFNDVLSRRLTDGLLRTVLPGDVMSKWPFGGMFTAEDVAVEQARFDARETVSAGPMFGRKTFATKGVAAEREATVLAEAGLSAESFEGFGKLVMGTRRHNLIYLDDLTAQREPDGLRLKFSLPAGSYATVLLREIMKADVDGEETGE
jgi:tRNA pseudouridine13 synthase